MQDYWQLNEAMIKNKHLLPLIQELIDKVQGVKYFTKLNIQWRYNNVRIRRRVEGSLPNQQRSVQASSHVLWHVQLTCNLSTHNGHIIP